MNHYLLRDEDPDCFYQPQVDEPADAVVNFPPPLPRGPQLFTAMSSARAEWFDLWRDSITARRDESYEALKQRITANVMSTVEARLPGLRGRLRVIDASTPLTIRDYARYPGGGLYGLEPSLLSQGRNGVRRRTRYAGLYVAGAGTGTPGILGACVTGFGVAGAILGTEALIREVRAETEPAQGMDSARAQSTIPQ
jgi:phytoene dehydrogenase-like protein